SDVLYLALYSQEKLQCRMERLSGTIERITFYNPDNGYTVLKLLPDQRRLDAARDGTVAVVGMLPELSVGETVEFTGQWVENKTYGKQFEAERVTTVTPTSIQGLINYRGSGLVKGIGPVTAERIVNHFGLRTLEILAREPDRLYEIPAIKPRLIERLIDTWSKTQAARNAMIFL